MKRGTRLDLLGNPSNFLCLVLAGLGFSDKLISARTGLTSGQISYRARKALVQRKHYRNGESLIARRVLGSTRNYVASTVRRRIERRK